MSLFPGAISSFAGFTSGHTLSADSHAAQHNSEQAEIIATQTKIGTGASTPVASQVLRGTGTGTSSWGQVALTTDVTGVLPVGSGGTGQGTLTNLPLVSPVITSGGSWSGSPTLTTPTIASFTNAQHDHSNAAGGGNIPFAGLLPTIFSGQVQSQVNAGTGGGAIWWINLGGVKLMWIQSASKTSFNSPTYTFTLPAFFTTISTILPSIAALGTDVSQVVVPASVSISNISLFFNSIANSAGALLTASLLVIGT